MKKSLLSLSGVAVFSSEEQKMVKGGITYCGYLAGQRYLISKRSYDQSVVLTQMVNRGDMQFEDWNYDSGNIPGC